MYALAAADPPILSDECRLMRHFLAWLPQAAALERATAVNALARAYLHCELAPTARAQAEKVMTAILDDPEPQVRRGLAEALASARAAPRHIVLAIAGDNSDVSRVVLTLSPLLSDADLVDATATGDTAAQTAIARRPMLTAPVTAALADVGDRAAILALIANSNAEIPRNALWRLFERFRDDAETRTRLAERSDLPSSLRAAVAASTCMNKRVSTSLPANMKFLIMTVPTGKTHLPVSAGPFAVPSGATHSAKAAEPASGMQFLTWMVPPSGITKARDFAAPSDQRGLLTS